MRYDDEFRAFAIEYYEEVRSLRKAASDLKISCSTLQAWRKEAKRPKLKKSKDPHFRYPEDIVRLAIGLVYGEPGWCLREASYALGIPQSTIGVWKKRYVDGGIMEIPELDPNEIPSKSKAPNLPEGCTPADLMRRVKELELRNAVLEESLRVLKAGGVDDMTNAEKADVVDALSRTWKVIEILPVVGLSSSSYYYRRSVGGSADKYADVRAEVRRLFKESRRSYGYRRIHAKLRRSGTVVFEKVVRRLMSEEGLVVPRKRTAKKFTTYVGEISEAPPNLIRRDFHADAPNEKWLTDITEMKAADGKVYLSPVIDCFDGMVVAYKAGTNPSAELANSMLEEACSTLPPEARPVIHNDRGSHYRWDGWIAICEEHNLVRSMSKKGCTPDNSACEGFFGRMKNESYYADHWSRKGCADLIAAVDDYIEWYNNARIKESLGWMSPVEYRRSLGLMGA